MKKEYIRSTKGGYSCQTEVTWGQWIANRINDVKGIFRATR